MGLSRRDFLAASAAGGMAMAAPAVHGAAKTTRYRTALVGAGWWGTNVLGAAIESGTVEPIALCDVDENQLNTSQEKLSKLTTASLKRYKDYRELLEEEKPQIVIVATPDHWHPLVTIAACEAGAHVYVEKPICHTIHEGTAMVKTARRTERVVQVDTHRRASPHNISGMQFLRDGKAGTIGMVRSFVHYGGGPGTPTPDSDPPEGLDWDFWCGPGPLVPFNKRIHPRGFRQFLQFANGTLGDWGIHWMDQVLWWSEEKWPKKVACFGGRHIRRDTPDAPDTQVVVYDFDSFTATWEHRRYAANNAEKHNIGCYFYGTEGTFHMGWRDGWNFYPVNKNKPPLHEDPQFRQPDDQNIPELWADFIRCIETRQRPICDIEIGYRSTCMSLLGMLSLKLGRSVEWDGENHAIVGDPEANALLRREYRKPWVYPDPA